MQVAPEDCTGCGVCVGVCPAKDKADPRKRALTKQPQLPLREAERENYAFFLALPEVDRTKLEKIDVKTSQFMRPLFEYSGACGGCGETPYVKLLTQLFGDRAIIANATGCSSIYGGNLPTTPYCVDENGRGPSWANSLFEDNAEYGFGFRLAVDQNKNLARHLLKKFAPVLGDELVTGLLEGDQYTEKGVFEQRQRVELLREKLAADSSAEAKALSQLGDYLVRKSVWMVGGDGWAYDIGYGGLDHVLANTRDVNLLVLDTEVYSNTGGQASKATPLGAAAKFAASGKAVHKKDLGLMAMAYGHVYVASVAMGARDLHTVKAFQEADSYDGPSLIIAYSHCIAHGYDLAKGPEQQKLAVETGMWPLYRFDPRRLSKGEAPLVMEAWPPKGRVVDFMRNETRFKMVEKMDSERFQLLGRLAQDFSSRRVELYDYLAKLSLSKPGTTH
jgi:pyruvate-ferredoxin/flavodoxin oxidoreductase